METPSTRTELISYCGFYCVVGSDIDCLGKKKTFDYDNSTMHNT